MQHLQTPGWVCICHSLLQAAVPTCCVNQCNKDGQVGGSAVGSSHSISKRGKGGDSRIATISSAEGTITCVGHRY
jgi:hypothetical protein